MEGAGEHVGKNGREFMAIGEKMSRGRLFPLDAVQCLSMPAINYQLRGQSVLTWSVSCRWALQLVCRQVDSDRSD